MPPCNEIDLQISSYKKEKMCDEAVKSSKQFSNMARKIQGKGMRKYTYKSGNCCIYEF